jgi:hypothetical protein
MARLWPSLLLPPSPWDDGEAEVQKLLAYSSD